MKHAREHQHQEGGFTLLETVVAMSLFAIGVMALAQVQFSASGVNMRSRHTSTATMLASDRLEQSINGLTFDAITSANFGDEDFGAINGGDERYGRYRRTVSIIDQLDVAGRVTMKTVTVRVFWFEQNGERNVELASRVARF